MKKIRSYWMMTKSLQTGLLLLTGLTGYMSARCPVKSFGTLLGLTVSLSLAISGSTVLNMVRDRDIDARMQRTCNRPLPSGKVSAREALVLGIVMVGLGVGLAMSLNPLYGLIVFAGFAIDVFIYTLWLKRRTAWSILWGGIAGSLPALAGRTLGVGAIDWTGIALALTVLFWIPTHIMTFNLRYLEDYQRANIPTFPSRYGEKRTHWMIAFSSMAAAGAMGIAAIGVGISWGYLRLLSVLSIGLLLLAGSSILRPSARLNFGLFKYASVFLLSSMLIVFVATL